jgi:hypothetical protein
MWVSSRIRLSRALRAAIKGKKAVMEMPNLQPNLRIGPFKKLLLTIAGVDEETLRKCPNHDHEAIYAIASIQLCVWCFEATVFYLIGARLASAGEFHPEILVGALGLSTFMLMVDSFVVLRSGWHLSGIVQLKRGGLDVSGGPLARLKATTFLFIRIQLSGCIALLSGIFFGLLVFASDLDARTGNTYRNANNQLIAQAAENVDAAIQRATEAVGAQNTRVEALSTQLNTLRQHQVDPGAAEPAVQQTQQEVAQLLARKAKLDDALLAAEAFGSQELAGAAGEGHSGKPGAGPRHRAALELVRNARDHVQDAAHQLDAAQARLAKRAWCSCHCIWRRKSSAVSIMCSRVGFSSGAQFKLKCLTAFSVARPPARMPASCLSSSALRAVHTISSTADGT